MVWHKQHIAVLLALALSPACSDTSLSGKSLSAKGDTSGQSSDGGSNEAEKSTSTATSADSTDIPVWVNAAMLTCDWRPAPDATKTNVACALSDAQGNALKPDPAKPVTWSVQDKDGTTVNAPQAPVADGVGTVFTLEAKKVADLSVVASGKKAALAQTLPGLKDDSGLAECFDKGIEAQTCLDQFVKTGEPGTSSQSAQQTNSTLPAGSPLLAFVTKDTYLLVTLGGGAGDLHTDCFKEASAAGLPGAWRAMVPSTNMTVVQQIGIGSLDSPVYDVKGNVISHSLNEMLQGQSLTTPLNLAANGQTVTGQVVTGTMIPGVSTSGDETCSNWGSPAGSTVLGTVGGSGSSWLTQNIGASCTSEAHIYCFGSYTGPAL